MIALARAHTKPDERVDYRVADVIHATLPAPTYDAVVTVNMIHHLALGTIVPRLAELVSPGGALIIQDIVTRPGLRNLPINLIAAIWTRGRRLIRRENVSRRVRKLYDQHGRDETYLEPSTVLGALSPYIPGVRVTHHLGWRYTAVWFRGTMK